MPGCQIFRGRSAFISKKSISKAPPLFLVQPLLIYYLHRENCRSWIISGTVYEFMVKWPRKMRIIKIDQIYSYKLIFNRVFKFYRFFRCELHRLRIFVFSLLQVRVRQYHCKYLFVFLCENLLIYFLNFGDYTMFAVKDNPKCKFCVHFPVTLHVERSLSFCDTISNNKYTGRLGN